MGEYNIDVLIVFMNVKFVVNPFVVCITIIPMQNQIIWKPSILFMNEKGLNEFLLSHFFFFHPLSQRKKKVKKRTFGFFFKLFLHPRFFPLFHTDPEAESQRQLQVYSGPVSLQCPLGSRLHALKRVLSQRLDRARFAFWAFGKV